MNIQPACQQDLPEILAVQREAFEAEAQLVNDWNIPPLTQTLDELTNDWRKGIMLKAVNEYGIIVGTVRGHTAPDGFYIGRLAVLPQWQGRRVGRLRMRRSRMLTAKGTAAPFYKRNWVSPAPAAPGRWGSTPVVTTNV